MACDQKKNDAMMMVSCVPADARAACVLTERFPARSICAAVTLLSTSFCRGVLGALSITGSQRECGFDHTFVPLRVFGELRERGKNDVPFQRGGTPTHASDITALCVCSDAREC